jgi:hypothetical protein
VNLADLVRLRGDWRPELAHVVLGRLKLGAISVPLNVRLS